MEIHKKRCKVKAEQALYKVAKLMLWCTSSLLMIHLLGHVEGPSRHHDWNLPDII